MYAKDFVRKVCKKWGDNETKIFKTPQNPKPKSQKAAGLTGMYTNANDKEYRVLLSNRL